MGAILSNLRCSQPVPMQPFLALNFAQFWGNSSRRFSFTFMKLIMCMRERLNEHKYCDWSMGVVANILALRNADCE